LSTEPPVDPVPIQYALADVEDDPRPHGASCRVFAVSVPAHPSGSTCPTGAGVIACGRSLLSLFPATQRRHRALRLRQWFPSLALRLYP